METRLEKSKLHDLLEPCAQTHLLHFWNDLTTAGRQQLASQILSLDWPALETWIREATVTANAASDPTEIEPAPYYPAEPENSIQAKLYRSASERGQALLRAGHVAGFTVAGGQGTRLGYDGPKGTFPISPLRGKPLFQIFAESVARAREKYGAPIPWCIMTSPLNDAATRKFFADNDFFGLDPAGVHLFPQGTLPAVDKQGKVLLRQPDSLALAPNGHGGCLAALRDSGALPVLAAQGIEYLSYWQVDNPLVQPFDPLFLGLHALEGAEMSSRCLIKKGPDEGLGNFCLRDGKTAIIEYSDMAPDRARERDEQGRLRFRAGSPAIHILNRAFVERLTANGCRLPIHRAEKKVQAVDENGNLVWPQQPNAIKLEMFIFDALPLARHNVILEAVRNEHFAPVKSANGHDSVTTCREHMLNRAASWLEAAGIRVPRHADGTPAWQIELSPRRYLDVEDVKANRAALRLPPPDGKGTYD